ncbi:glycosyl hydrolase family 18 protein [Yokenella regensburgei]|uniref:glycosyl hydrolase family 18 protein n=1 Tax=Yokenella regensburgei TaxID=158877 RepID=UPI0031D27F6F
MVNPNYLLITDEVYMCADKLMASSLSMNDDTNTISGLTTSHMFSKNNGSKWIAYKDESQNSFPGTVTVIVATKDEQAIKAVDYDASTNYATTGTLVRYNGSYWTNGWYANAGEIPGSAEVWKKAGTVSISTQATFNFTPFTGQKAKDFQSSEKARIAEQRKIIGYFPEWGVYEAHNYFTPDKIDFSQLTHLNYAFSIVKDGEAVVYDTWKGPELLPQLRELTAQAGVTYMVSFGGWSNVDAFEKAVSTGSGIDKLVASMVSFMQEYDFDGIDVDWEYPDSSSEKGQFTSLIQKLRSKLDQLGLQQDKYYQLTAAVTTNHNNVGYINLAVTAPLFDSVNVMAYDIHGAFDPITGHNAPLFANHLDSDPLLNVASTMKVYHETYGVPKRKLMMGIPYYGRGWGGVAPTEKIKGLPGLFAAGTATVKGAWDDTDFTGTNPYYVLKEKLASGAYKRYWDDESKVPYLYNASTKEFLTYDDPESIQTKVDYILDQDFGGTILWDLSGDTADHELGKIVAQLKDTDVDGGDDEPVISGDIANPALFSQWTDFDVNTYNNIIRFGLKFDVSESDFLSGQYDIYVNDLLCETVLKGTFTAFHHDDSDTGSNISHNGTTRAGYSEENGSVITVKSGRLPLHPDDVISVVSQQNGVSQTVLKMTTTRQMLQIGLVAEVDGLENFTISSWYPNVRNMSYPAATVILSHNYAHKYQVHLNGKCVADMETFADGGHNCDQIHFIGLTRTADAYCVMPEIVFKQGDDFKLYEVSNGAKTLVGQITVPEGIIFGNTI